jgi:predicted deacylase
MALHHLMPMLRGGRPAGRIRGEIVIVPTINPIGHLAARRQQPLWADILLGATTFNRNWLDLSGRRRRRTSWDATPATMSL